MGRTAGTGAGGQHQGQHLCAVPGGGGADGCGCLAVCGAPLQKGPCPPHRLCHCLLCRAHADLLFLEHPLCGHSGCQKCQRGRHRRNQRPLVRCGHQRHQDFAGPAGGGLLRRAPEPVHPSHGRYGPPVLDFGWSAEHDRPGPQCCGADSAGVLGGGHLRQRPPAQAAHWLHRGAVPCMLCGV